MIFKNYVKKIKTSNFLITESEEQLERWNEYLHSVPMISSAVKVLKKIESKGYVAYITGGTVRDIILGAQVHDVDICTNCPIDVINSLYKTYDIGKSKDFGIVVVRQDGHAFEVAQFREDGTYLDGRRPESVKVVMDFKGDASRRDFTINAMAIDKDGNIIDYFDGRKDIKNKVIRTVGNPKDRFQEDYLRMLRVARFSSKLGFEVDPDTKQAVKDLSINISKLAPERIKDEIFKAATQTGDKFAKYMVELDEVGILDIILPEITKLKTMVHPQQYHPEGPTVWEHIIEALKQNKVIDPIINLAILFHDVGKGVTLQYKDDGTPMYKGHDAAGADIIDQIADRLKMSNKERETLKFVAVNHMKVFKLKDMKPSKIAKMLGNEDWGILLATAKADEFCRKHLAMSEKEYDELINIAIDIKERWGIQQGKKAIKLVDGNHVMDITNLKPSKKIGEIIKKTEEWILDNNITNQNEIDKYILSLV